MGPVLFGAIILMLFDRHGAVASLGGWRKTFLYPFHREALAGVLGLHVLMGVLVCVVPTYHMVVSVLAADAIGGAQLSTYQWFWGH